MDRYDEIDIIYVPYNYFASKAEQELFPAARKKDLAIVVIKPFNKGTVFDPRLPELIRGGGARSVLRAHSDRVVHVPADQDCLVDLDSPQDLIEARRRLPGRGETP